MKFWVVLVIISVVFPIKAYAQHTPNAEDDDSLQFVVCLSSVAPRAATGSMTSAPPLTEDCGQQLSINAQGTEYGDGVNGSPGQYIRFRFGSTTEPRWLDPVSEAHVDHIQVTAGSLVKPFVPQEILAGDSPRRELTIPVSQFRTVPNGSIIAVRLYFQTTNTSTSTEGRPVREFFFRLRQPVSYYGVANTGLGFWLPVGLFGTYFDRTSDDLHFAAFPVGLAWGLRLAPSASSDFYLGISAMGNWSIGQSATGSGSTSDFNLAGLSIGALLDISNYAYLGYSYVMDLRSGHDNPGHALVIGVGPGTLQALQATR